MSFHLFLIVFSAFHLAPGNLGLAMPPTGYAAYKDEGAPDDRTPIEGTRTMLETEFRTGGPENRRRRPVQQYFFNIYIKDSPSLRVNNIIRSENFTSKSLLGYDLENEAINGTVAGEDSDARMRDCSQNSYKCRGVLDAETNLDAVSREYIVKRENVSTETLEISADNIAQRFQGQREEENLEKAFDNQNDEFGSPPGDPTPVLRYPNRSARNKYGNASAIEPTAVGKDLPLVKFMADYPKRKDYPVYGSHSYHEIMRKLLQMKFGKKATSDEYKMTENMTQ